MERPVDFRFEVFVGNLTFNTTEEQLREHFSFVGPVKNVRLLRDRESDRPKGFAFIEYYESHTALSAIKHLDQSDLNARKIKVTYPNQSILRTIAREIGQAVPDEEPSAASGAATTVRETEAQVLGSVKMHEAWDLLEAMRTYILDDRRGQKSRAILEAYPQVIPAMYELQKRLGIQAPTAGTTVPVIPNE